MPVAVNAVLRRPASGEHHHDGGAVDHDATPNDEHAAAKEEALAVNSTIFDVKAP